MQKFISIVVRIVVIALLSPSAMAQQAQSARAFAVESGISPATPNASRYVKLLKDYYTEYDPSTCKFTDSGTWTITKKAARGDVTTGTITRQSTACPGKTFTYAAIYYQWRAKQFNNNKIVTDSFNATWKTSDGHFNSPFVYNIEVNVVRPDREHSVFSGFVANDSRANWMQQLIPKAEDAPFDFSGEKVKERFVNYVDECANKSVGKGAYFGSTPKGKPAEPWTVSAGNMWGPDQVGYGPCALELYRCVRVTPCGYFVNQEMSIKSPVDKDFVPYTMNVLKADIDGHVLSPAFTKTKESTGTSTSQRGDGARQPPISSPTMQTSCPADAKLPC